jgi:hypothetical protein
MVAKSINALRGRWENFWATEQPNAVYLVGAEDRFDKLVYLLANPVADHLVERVSDWPRGLLVRDAPVGAHQDREAAAMLLRQQEHHARRDHAPPRAPRWLRVAHRAGVDHQAP